MLPKQRAQVEMGTSDIEKLDVAGCLGTEIDDVKPLGVMGYSSSLMTKIFRQINFQTKKCPQFFRSSKNSDRTFYHPKIFVYVYLSKCANYCNCKHFTTRKADLKRSTM